jgi:hypothetical protein
VKEEILTRWGELGLRVMDGMVRFQPVLLDAREVPIDGALSFTWRQVPFRIVRGAQTAVRVHGHSGWRTLGCAPFDLRDATAVEASVCFDLP